MKLSELLENISDMDRRIKAHLNTLFHSKTGNLIIITRTACPRLPQKTLIK